MCRCCAVQVHHTRQSLGSATDYRMRPVMQYLVVTDVSVHSDDAYSNLLEMPRLPIDLDYCKC